MLPRLECNGVISLQLLPAGFNGSSTSASGISGTTGVHDHVWLFSQGFVFISCTCIKESTISFVMGARGSIALPSHFFVPEV